MKGPMIHNRQGINIPERNLAVVSVLLDTKAPQPSCFAYVTCCTKRKA